MNYYMPGVYVEHSISDIKKTELMDCSLAGFIGLAEKGPIHKGIRIKSFQEYKDVFGNFVDYSYLSYAVYGFFSTGGKECVVVRTAHTGGDVNSGIASSAESVIDGVHGAPATKFTATSAGSWGNDIELKIQHVNDSSYKVLSYEIIDDKKLAVRFDSSIITVSKNDFICLRGNETVIYVRIDSIEDETILLDLKDEIKDFFLSNREIVCETIRLNICIINKHVVEEYLYLSANPFRNDYYADVINSRSKIVRVDVADKSALIGNVNYKHLQSGCDGIVDLVPADFIGYYKGCGDNKGLGIFEAYPDIALIAAPDIMVFEDLVCTTRDDARNAIYKIQQSMVVQCEKHGNRFAILDTPTFNDINDTMQWCKKFDSGYAGVYHPRVEILNPEDIAGSSTVLIPPSGHVAGIYNSCDRSEGIHRAPANKFINGAVGTKGIITNRDFETFYSLRINCLMNVPGRGVKIWGAKTLSSDSSWKYINVRRTFSAIKEALKQSTAWAVFEPNNQMLMKRLVRHVTAFLIEIWRKGLLAGKTAEEAFFVQCDSGNNLIEDIDNGIINVEVGLAVSKPAEFIVIQLQASSDNSTITVND